MPPWSPVSSPCSKLDQAEPGRSFFIPDEPMSSRQPTTAVSSEDVQKKIAGSMKCHSAISDVADNLRFVTAMVELVGKPAARGDPRQKILG